MGNFSTRRQEYLPEKNDEHARRRGRGWWVGWNLYGTISLFYPLSPPLPNKLETVSHAKKLYGDWLVNVLRYHFCFNRQYNYAWQAFTFYHTRPLTPPPLHPRNIACDGDGFLKIERVSVSISIARCDCKVWPDFLTVGLSLMPPLP